MEASGLPRVALIHDWLTGMRGGEKCLEALCRRWPHARLFTLLHSPGSVSEPIERLQPTTSFLQWLPGVAGYYRYLLPVLPLAARWKLPPCDLAVSFSHCVAKAARPPAGVPHVCYCFTPMRYAWHMREAYFDSSRMNRVKAFAIRSLLARLRQWDRQTAERVTHFVAISQTIRQRIRDCYDRDAAVIYPPVDTDFYTPVAGPRENYFLALSAFAPYKRIDLAIAACNELHRPLLVIGTGQDERRLALAGPTVQFLGWQSDERIRHHLRRCRALLFPGEEDFGIVPVEAMACGAPVIAFGKGGATETVVARELPKPGRPATGEEPTGILFPQQTVECLVDSMQRLDVHRGDFAPAASRRQAVRFNRQRFEEELFSFLDRLIGGKTVPLRRAG